MDNMGKYKNIKVFIETFKKFKRIKNLYELQDGQEYTISQILDKLVNEREERQFKLPITDKKVLI